MTCHLTIAWKNCVFVFYLAEVVTIVFSGKTGTMLGALDPMNHPEIGSQSGWLDTGHSTNVVELPDGRIVFVAQEDALHVLIYTLEKGTCD